MPERPKPDRIAVLVAAAFLSWLMLRSKVLTLFKLCKDLEYVSLLYLMEEAILMFFFHYPVISRSSNLDNYLQTMRRFAVLFICWRRRHYDKSTLSFLSDTAHQKLNSRDYYSTKRRILASLTEKKVEIWHSLLRDSIERHYPAERIKFNAKVLNTNKTQMEFKKHFVSEYLRGTGERDQTLLAGRSTEFMIKKLQLIAKNLHSSKQVGWTKWKST